ncbi:MAG: isochorismatase family protein [Thermomicrobiales bacterium]
MRHPLTRLTNDVPAIRLEPAHTCLILQDVHSPFADGVDGWLARKARDEALDREFDEYFETLDLVSGNFPVLAESCRRAGIEVVYACMALSPNPTHTALQEAMGWTWEVDGPDWRFPDRWQPADHDHIYVKEGWGALSSSGFTFHLVERAIHSVIIAGTMYDYGIRQTCYELADRSIASLVASDAVVATTNEAGSDTSGNLAHGLTKLRSTSEILDLLDIVKDQGYVLV